MPARTGSRDSPSKTCAEAPSQPGGIAAHLAGHNITGSSLFATHEDPWGIQVVRQREAPSNTSGNRDQDTALDGKIGSFVEEYCAMFLVASFFGVHVIKRLGDGCYALCPLRLFVSFLVLCLGAGCLALVAVAFYLRETTRDLRLIAVGLLLSGLASFTVFFAWLTESSKIMAFLAEVDANTVRVKKPRWLPLVMVALCLMPLVYTLSFLFMTPLTDYFDHMYLGLVFHTPMLLSALLTGFMDVYIMASVHVVVAALRGLEARVRGAGIWTPRLTNEVAEQWLRITKLLGTCNEVSNEEKPPDAPLKMSVRG